MATKNKMKINKLFNCVVPIYELGPQKEPKILGSSILIKIDNNMFLISAAHVLKYFTKNNHLYIPCNNDFYALDGYLSLGHDSKITDDIAIFYISDKLHKLIEKTYKPLDHQASGNIVETKNSALFISGFPGGKSKTSIFKNNVSYTRMDIQTEVIINQKPNLHERYKDRIFNVTYPKRKDKNHKMPKPNGISGGGVFLTNIMRDNSVKVTLLGINISYKNYDEHNLKLNILRAIMINSILLHEYSSLKNKINLLTLHTTTIEDTE